MQQKMIGELEGLAQEQAVGSAEKLLACFQKLEHLMALLDRGLNYSERNADVDTADAHYQALSGKMMGVYHRFETALPRLIAGLCPWKKNRSRSFTRKRQASARTGYRLKTCAG